jgi:hypothetical protein
VQIHPTIVKSRKFGDFEILFQYVNEEPALVIRAHRFLSIRRRAWVVTQESAWKYVDDVASPGSGHSEYMVHASSKIAAMLGLGNDIQTRFRIAEGIMDCLEDLINMKPMKIDQQKSSGEVEGMLTIGDEQIAVGAELEGTTINSTEGFSEVAPHPSELARGDA